MSDNKKKILPVTAENIRIERKIASILNEAQFTTDHRKACKELMEIYRKVPKNYFRHLFISCVRHSTQFPESKQLLNVFNFIARFIHGINDSHRTAQLKTAKVKENYLVNHILYLAAVSLCNIAMKNENLQIRANASLLIEKIGIGISKGFQICGLMNCLFEKLKDPSPLVRERCIRALAPVQRMSTRKNNVVVKFYMHLKFDPSFEVRKTIVKVLEDEFFFNSTIVRACISDSSVNVRLQAYLRLSSPSFLLLEPTIKQNILKSGFGDTDKRIFNFVTTKLVATWYSSCGNDVFKLLLVLNDFSVEGYSRYQETIRCVLKNLVEEKKLDIFEQFPQKSRTLLPSVNHVTIEVMISWDLSMQNLLDTIPNLNDIHSLFKRYKQFKENDLKSPDYFPEERKIVQLEYEDCCLVFYQILSRFHPIDTVNGQDILDYFFDILRDQRLTYLEVKAVVEAIMKTLMQTGKSHNVLFTFIEEFHDSCVLMKKIPASEEDTSQGQTCIPINVDELKYLLSIYYCVSSLVNNAKFMLCLHQKIVTPYFVLEADPDLVRKLLICVQSLCLSDQNFAVENFPFIYHKIFHINTIISITALKVFFDIIGTFGLEEFEKCLALENAVALAHPSVPFKDFDTLFLRLGHSIDPIVRSTTVCGIVKLILRMKYWSSRFLAMTLMQWCVQEMRTEKVMCEHVHLLLGELSDDRGYGQKKLADALLSTVLNFSEARCTDELSGVTVDTLIGLSIRLTEPPEGEVHYLAEVVVECLNEINEKSTNETRKTILAKILFLCANYIKNNEFIETVIHSCEKWIQQAEENSMMISYLCETLIILRSIQNAEASELNTKLPEMDYLPSNKMRARHCLQRRVSTEFHRIDAYFIEYTMSTEF